MIAWQYRLNYFAALGLCYAQIVTDFSDELFLNFTMSRNGGRRAISGVAKDSVPQAFSNEDAALRFYVPDEVGSFHCCQAARKMRRSRVTLAFVEKSRSNSSRFASRTI